MKLIIIWICFLLILLLAFSCNSEEPVQSYKYQIKYSRGEYWITDFTNGYKLLPNGCVEYTDENDINKTRCGSFDIIKQ